MDTNRQIRELLDATAYDAEGDKLGSVKEVFLNDVTGQPDFVEINHGLFGMNSSLVPLRGHSLAEAELRLAFTKDRIQDVPDLHDDAHLSAPEQQQLYAHYGLDATTDVSGSEPDQGPAAGRTIRTAGVGAGADPGLADVNAPNLAEKPGPLSTDVARERSEAEGVAETDETPGGRHRTP